jgi:hypothetical protein
MANKKINQLVSKTAILSTDIFGIGDATTGQLFKKTIAELQAAIGGAVISVNGLVGTIVLDTDDIQELANPTNKYFTDARARGAISLTVTGSSGASTYNSGTGVLNVPTYTLAGLGGITASFLSGTSGISYNSTTGVISYTGTVYTDASIRGLISASTGLSYNSSTGVFTNTITQYTDALARASISAGTGISYSSTTGIIASTITQYTDALARASISAGTGISYSSGTGIIASTITQYTDALSRSAHSLTTTGSSGASTYNSTTGVLNVPTYTLVGLGGITATFLSGTSGISYNSTTGVISYSGTVYTDASIRALLSGATGITYNSSTGAISYSGTVYTDASVRALISITTTGTSGASTYNNTTGVINVPNYTLAGLGGISLTSLSGGTGITYNNTTGAISYSGTVYTDASVRALVSAGTGLSYNSSTGVFTSSITQYTDALARASISITTTGTSGASTYNSTTGVLNIPQYQGIITLTTTGTSGAATFSSNTLNIPQYQAVLTNPVTGTGTSGYHAKWTSSSAIGNGLIYDSGTNIGINTSSPNYNLHINSSGINSFLQLTSTTTGSTSNDGFLLGTGDAGDAVLINRENTNMFFYTNNSVRMAINSTGSIGINTNSPSQKLEVVDTNDTFIKVRNTAGGGYATGFRLKAGSDNEYGFIGADNYCYIRDFTSAVNRLTLFNNGNFAINTGNDNGYRFYVAGTIYATGNITANSDISLKKNLTIIDNPTDKLMQLNGYTYQWKSDDSHQYGVIAQEVEKILPYAVSTGNDGIKGVSYNQIIPVLIEAVKEQKAKIENLEILLASK